MALILCLETSSKNCSVSICKDGQMLFIKEYFDENYCHGEQLHVLIEDLLSDSNISIRDFDAFAFSCGPGSYTGLRIGAASIKGFSFALDKPAIAISTLKLMTSGVLNDIIKFKNNSLLCPVIDSRKDEVYTALYTRFGEEYLAPFACNVVSFSFLEYLEKNTVYFFGPGKYKLQNIEHKNAFFLHDNFPSAKHLASLVEEEFNNHNFVDIAYFEPMYLKDFIPTKSKKSTQKL
tara:strand:+ start:14285 stop:14986 length:702 start_codon:yes stop_codon:yes gene_type:complete